MKVLFVVSQLGTGGAERVISTLANYCAKQAHDVTVITFRSTSNAYVMNDSVKCVQIGSSGHKFTEIFRRIFAIRKYITKNDIDVYVSFELNYGICAVYGLRRKLKYITSMRNDPKHDKVSLVQKLLRFVNFAFADRVVFQTNEIKDYFPMLIRNHGIVIMNPIRDGLKEFHGERKNEIVAVCRLEKQKNIPMLIAAFEIFHQRFPNYRLNIYGDGSLRHEMEKLVHKRQLTDCVIFSGFQDSIDEKIETAAMYVCSSDYEGLSNSLIEAMAIGLPCVSTDSCGGGARAVIQDGVNGFLVPIGDYKSMAQRMIEIIENPLLGESISKEAVKIRDKLSESTICEQWVKLFIG